MNVTITAIDTIAIRIPFDIWAPPPVSRGVPRTHVESLYVRVTTSNGVIGWGESHGSVRPMVIAAYDHWIRGMAVGQSATDEGLIPRIERTLMPLGRAGPLMAAVSGLDIALWDIRGKLEGVPVSALLGGAKRTQVECYASLMQYNANPEHLKRNTTRALEQGYRWIKLHERTPEAVAVAREAIGPDIPLMVDTNCAWTTADAEAAVASMAPFNPYWVEEPLFPPEDFEFLAGIRKNTRVPLAMGENATSRTDFRRMVATGAADYVQPAIVKMGGISALSTVAAQVEQAGATCVPNAFYIGPGYLAVLHCMAAKEKPAPLERMFANLKISPFAKTLQVMYGSIPVPDGPGLGADPEEEVLSQFKM
jgi:L-alanine-DL-glutamate epimerase-like enolase superfamily enzyme